MGNSAALGALLGGGLGAGASALATQGREGESKKMRLKRMLRNALAGGVMGAGTGAAGGAALAMVPRMAPQESGIESWKNWKPFGKEKGWHPKGFSSEWSPFGTGTTTATGAAIGGAYRSNRIMGEAREKNILALLEGKMKTFEALKGKHAEAFRLSQAGEHTTNGKMRSEVEAAWKAMMGEFGGQKSNVLSTLEKGGRLPNAAEHEAIQKSLLGLDKHTYLPGDPTKHKTFVDRAAMRSQPDFARFGPLQTKAPSWMQRAGYQARRVSPFNRGALGGGLVGMGLSFLPQITATIANRLDE